MIDTHKLCKQLDTVPTSQYVNKHEVLENGTDLINIHRRTRNFIYEIMAEILFCLGSDLKKKKLNSFIHIVVHKSDNVKGYDVQMLSDQTYDMELELCTISCQGTDKN